MDRRGDGYGCRVSRPGESMPVGGLGRRFPDVWIYWSGEWPADDPWPRRH